MTLNITLPEIDMPGRKSTESKTKDLIISILIRDHPLTSRKLHRALKSEYQYMVTYQAVHKAVKLLLEQKVLKMEGKGYSINEGWIDNVTKFVDELHSVYHKKKPLFGVKEAEKKEGMQTLMFASLKDSMEYITTLQFEYFSKPNPKPPYCAHLYHYNFPIAYATDTHKLMDAADATVTPWYIITKNNTKLDIWTANNLQKNPLIKVKTGVDVAQNCDTRVFGDIVVQTYIPKEAIEFMDKLFREKEALTDINVHEFQESVYNKQRDVKVVVFHNPEIARQLRKQTLGHFNIKKVAFLDLDGPLLSRPPIIDFTEFLTKRGLFLEENMKKIRKLYHDYTSGKIPYSTFSLTGIDCYIEGLAGNKVEDLDKAAREFVDSIQGVYEYTKPLIAFLRSKGYFIVGISASTEDLLKPYMKHLLGIDLLYTTKIGVVENKMSHQFETHLGREYAKESVMLNFLYNNNIDHEKSIAFGDTLNDIPLLRFVGMPIALNPNHELRDYAAAKGWNILTKEDDVIERVRVIMEENKKARNY